jgi:hypothetical protein
MLTKIMQPLLVLCGAASLLTACNDHSATPSRATYHAGTAPESSTPRAPRAFAVNTLSLNDGENELQGCTTELTRVGAPEAAGPVFRESSSDTEGTGFIRIEGALIHVHLTSRKSAELTAEGHLPWYTNVFEDNSHTTRVVEALNNGATNEQTDSSTQTGVLTVIHKGATETLRVEGGTAC